MITPAQFGTLDLGTGTFSPIGYNTSVTGLAAANGNLYGNYQSTLFKISPADGKLTQIGTSSVGLNTATGITGYSSFGSTLTGLYAAAGGYLYAVDAGTGAATKIGTGLLPQQCNIGSLSTNSPVLYYVCNAGDVGKVYTVDVTTGVPTFVGQVVANSSPVMNTQLLFLTALTQRTERYMDVPKAGKTIVSVNAATAGAVFESKLNISDSGLFVTGMVPLTTFQGPAVGGVVPIFSPPGTIQPGEWVSIFGKNLASAAATWAGDFPTSLGGASVTINGKSAYLWYVSPDQINLQAPDDIATGNVPVVVSTANGTALSSVRLARFAPSLSLLDGKHVTGIILRSNGSGAYGGGVYDIIGPTGSSLGYATAAVKAGDSVELFGVGFGPTNPSVPAGQAFSGVAPATSGVSLRINGVNVNASYVGLSGAGLFQINFTMPVGVGNGDVSLVAFVGSVSTQAGVVISLQ